MSRSHGAPVINKHNQSKMYFYSLLFVAFIQLSAYICIKTNPINPIIAVYITSALCVLSSVIISRQGEAFLRKENS